MADWPLCRQQQRLKYYPTSSMTSVRILDRLLHLTSLFTSCKTGTTPSSTRPSPSLRRKCLIRRLVRIGVFVEDRMKLDYVFKLGLLKSIHHAHVLIRQKDIRFQLSMILGQETSPMPVVLWRWTPRPRKEKKRQETPREKVEATPTSNMEQLPHLPRPLAYQPELRRPPAKRIKVKLTLGRARRIAGRRRRAKRRNRIVERMRGRMEGDGGRRPFIARRLFLCITW
ncbi:hypothetical protein PRIPAC_89766 [Pristionchus pacificus]|uniref:Uncharacterized protein n=1 Tax=Pristionchus pacificus TaxID=54126 RepID=A0A2A6CVQ5_PRIPA|nr:hypothetical protein PRIPAC_89766 [Pristionchus pacificus]|eukprot:PDM82127.1 hypothetical protein PRIPAC_36520 [Pristionchus pacificus]